MNFTKAVQYFLLLQGAAVSMIASSASAQTAEPAFNEVVATDDGGLGDIVVTAEKRENTAQKTPIAMNVYGADTLTRNGVGSLEDVAAFSPSIKFAQNQSAAIITVRGVSSRDDSEVGDPAVAVSSDGFYVQRPVGLTATLFDLERIEVLRGPQGTLYGRNATGGAVNIITAKPTFELAGRGSIEYGNYDTLNTEAMVNVPISDTFAVRAAFATRDHGGYRKVAPAKNGDDEDTKAVRLHLLFKPNEAFSALLTGEYLKQDGVGATGVGIAYVAAPDGSNSNDRPHIPGNGHEYGINTIGYTDVDTKTIKANISYAFEPVTLTYLGGYSEMKFHRQSDLDGTTTFSDGFQQNENPRTQNHELRLSSNSTGPLKWQIGAFRFEEKNSLLTYLQTFSGNGVFNWGIFDFPTIKATSNAVFGQASYAFTEQLTVEGGLRYTKDKKRRAGTTTFYGSGAFDDEKATTSATTWHGAVLFQATPANLLYAKVDRGYKAGGFNNGSDYEPEFLTAYEVGSKNRFLNDKLELNLTAFYYDYKDQQVRQFVDSVEREAIANAGKSTLYGLELESVAIVSPDDRFDFSASYLHARYDRLEVSSGSANIDLSGNPLPQAPKWSLSGGLQHRFNVLGGGLTARIQSRYESASYLAIYKYGRDRQTAYSKTDAMLTYEPADKRWSLQAYVRNIENRAIITVSSNNDDYGVNYYQFASPRTYGLRLSVNL